MTIKFRRADGSELPDRIEKVRYSGLEWMKDGSGIFYNSYPQQEGEKIVIAFVRKNKQCFEILRRNNCLYINLIKE